MASKMRIRLIWEGKTKSPHLRALEADYTARIGHFTVLVVEEMARARSAFESGRVRHGEAISAAERRLLEKVNGSYKVCLDAGGREWSSEEFARWLGRQALGGKRELAFLVGGTEGFSAAFKGQADLLLALSRMTLTRDWARVLLLEQLYRGFSILRGHPYPR
jgi:23S rRNA (pseudouridine1915-N3)-methyltransferase